MSKTNKVIIIGAGVAGMSSAMHLIESGYAVDIYEISNKVGGRCFSFIDKKFPDIILDNGQHVFAGAYKNFLELLDWLGTEKFLDYQKALNIKLQKKSGEIYSLDCSKLPGRLGLFSAIVKLSPLSFKEKFYLLSIIFSSINVLSSEKKDESALNFLRKKKQSENTIIHLWEPMILATLNASIDKASKKLFLTVLRILLLGGKSNSKLVFSDLAFSQLFSNFSSILTKNNSNVFLNSPIKKILLENESCLGVELYNGDLKTADFVISTLPPMALDKVINYSISTNNHKNKNIRICNYSENFNYSTIISIYLLFDKVVTKEKFLGSIGTNIQWITTKNMKIISSNSQKQLLSLTISAADEINKIKTADLLEIILVELAQILPETKKTAPIAYKIIRDKQATVLINSQNSLLRPNSFTNINNFFLAGDWTNTGLPATIESAALSGKIAAESIKNITQNKRIKNKIIK